MAQPLFARIEVKGAREATVYLTPEAESLGLLAAMGAEPIWCSIDRNGRGERRCPATTDLLVTMRLAEPPDPCDWLLSA